MTKKFKDKTKIKEKFSFGCLISGNGHLLKATINAINQGLVSFDLKLIIADRNCQALDIAKKYNIDHILIDHKSFDTREEFNAKLLQTLSTTNIDGLILNYNRLIDNNLIKYYPNKIINTHFSLLPAFPGFNSIKKALDYGVKFAGATCHLVDELADHGPIISQVITPINPNETIEKLGKKLFYLSIPLQLQTMEFLAQNRISCSNNRIATIDGALYNNSNFCPDLEHPLNKIQAKQLFDINS